MMTRKELSMLAAAEVLVQELRGMAEDAYLIFEEYKPYGAALPRLAPLSGAARECQEFIDVAAFTGKFQVAKFKAWRRELDAMLEREYPSGDVYSTPIPQALLMQSVANVGAEGDAAQ